MRPVTPLRLSSSQLRGLHAVQLEMLLEIDRVAKLLGLRYQIGAGTLLGAVRHQGFIPWDDDVDVTMPRGDYERLLALGPEVLGTQYFLQTHRSDPQYPHLYAKLRRNGSIFREIGYEHADFHQGIYVDIFPFDAIDTASRRGRWHLTAVSAQRRLAELSRDPNGGYLPRTRPWLQRTYSRARFRVLNRIPRRWLDGVRNALMRLREHSGAPEVVCLASIPNDRARIRALARPASEIEDSILLPFEGHHFPAPRAFHETLSRLYGDYLALPPVEKRRPGHLVTEFRLPPRPCPASG